LNAARLNLRRGKTCVIVPVRLTPKAARDEIVGAEAFGDETVLKARVRALPEGGRANESLEKLIAAWLGVPPSSVNVTQGGKSRLKQVTVEGNPDALAAAIAALLR
jgi:uncharacterized protein YggU (UPF0235/DUF167 family)